MLPQSRRHPGDHWRDCVYEYAFIKVELLSCLISFTLDSIKHDLVLVGVAPFVCVQHLYLTALCSKQSDSSLS